MPTRGPSARRVLVTGAAGPVAEAVIRQLEPEFDVVRATDGDHIPELMKSVQSVVILDGIWPWVQPARYATAVRAVTAGLLDAEMERIVAVAYAPLGPRDLARYEKVARLAEADLVQASRGRDEAGNERTVLLRCGLIVGTPGRRGPSDSSLFRGPRPFLPIPSPGTAVIAPILVDDFAKVVQGALRLTAPGTFDVGGPEEMTVDDLVRLLNGGDVRIWHVPAALRLSGRPQQNTVTPGAPRAAAQFGVKLEAIDHRWTKGAVMARDRSSRDDKRAAANRYARSVVAGQAGVFFSVLGIAGAGLALHDLFTVDDISVAVSSVLLGMASVLFLAAATGLTLVGWPQRFALAMLASAVSFFLGVLLLFAQINSGDPAWWRFVLWPAMIGYSAVLFLRLRRRGGPMLARLDPLRGFGRLVSAVGAGVIFSAFTFWYTNFYLPAQATPTVSLEATLTKVADRAGRHVLAAAFTAKNAADIPVTVLGAVFQVTRSKLAPGVGAKADSLGPRLANEQPIRRYSEVREETLVDTGEVVPIGFTMEKNEQITRKFRVYLPTAGADVATLRLYFILSRRKLTFSPFATKAPTVESGRLITHRDLNRDSSIRGLIRDNRYMHVLESLGSVGDREVTRCQLYPPLAVYIDRSPDVDPVAKQRGCAADAAGLATFYGLVGTSTVAQIDLSEPTA